MNKRILQRYNLIMKLGQERLEQMLKDKLKFHGKAEMARVSIETAQPQLWHMNGDPMFDINHTRYLYDKEVLCRYRFYGQIQNFGFQVIDGKDDKDEDKEDTDDIIIVQ